MRLVALILCLPVESPTGRTGMRLGWRSSIGTPSTRSPVWPGSPGLAVFIVPLRDEIRPVFAGTLYWTSNS